MIKSIADKFLKFFCREAYYPDIRGDLEENYRKHNRLFSRQKAEWLFLVEVILLLRPAIIRPIPPINTLNQNAMIRNYLKLAVRNLYRQKGYAFINIIGLATGIVSVFFIMIFVGKELSHDQHHHANDRLYRVSTEGTVNGEKMEMATTPPGLARRLISDLPGVEASARIVGFLGINKNILRVNGRSFSETGGYLADPNFFDLLRYPIVHGDMKTMLREPQSIVLSRTLSIRYFDSQNPVGKTLTIINDYGSSEYEVTGVFEDNVFPSHLEPAFVCSLNSGSIGKYVAQNDRVSGNNLLYTYVRLGPNVDPVDIGQQMPAFLSKYVSEARNTHDFVPVSYIYLHSGATNEPTAGGDIRYIYILITIALFILLIACINFANMATAQAARRGREIGIRKTFGAHRRSIVFQFLGESFLITFLAMLISLGFIFLLIPSFFVLTGIDIHLIMVLEKTHILLLITVITSLLAGGYPAFYLSTLNIRATLAGQAIKQSGSLTVRKSLVLVQLVIGILLIVGSLVISEQLRYLQSKPLGFESANRVVIPLQSDEGVKQLEKVKTTFIGLTGVVEVAGTTYTPSQPVLSDNTYRLSKMNQNVEGVVIRQNDVDFDLIELLNIHVIAGRTFDRAMGAETGTSVVLNEAAVTALGFGNDEIIGQEIFTEEAEGPVAYKVIGVVEDFHVQSLHRTIEPYLFAMRSGRGVKSVVVKIEPGNYADVLVSLEREWGKLFPVIPFEYHFLDRELMAQYDQETRFGQVITWFTGISLTLCLIGIFALTSFTVQQSLREIGIRKVLGASDRRLYSSFASKFLVLVLLAAVIAIPTGIILMNKWLELFAYSITPGVLTIIVPLGVVAISTLLVISIKLINAVRLNPVMTLRSD